MCNICYLILSLIKCYIICRVDTYIKKKDFYKIPSELCLKALLLKHGLINVIFYSKYNNIEWSFHKMCACMHSIVYVITAKNPNVN